MSNSDAIRAIINAHIKTNRKQEITGKILNSVLNQMVTDKDAGISEEAKLRAAEDERIEELINKEIGDRESADTEIQDALTKEIDARQEGDAAINNSLSEEVAARKDADTIINNALSAETSARQDEDAAIRNSLSEEVTARENADTNISNALSEEATTRENADTNINNALAEEKTAREEGDTLLLNAIRDAFSKGYLFAGVATTNTDPGTPNGKVFYIANGKGIYTNFGGLEVTDDDDFAIFTYDDTWAKSNVAISSSGGGIAQTMTETTYAELKNMRDNVTLTPGMWYRITDYECTTTQANTRSAGNKFDVIVLATSANTLSEQARAINHTPQEGETDYFANSNLSAWQIWYCLDNNSTRFAWADATNGKGVIYRMIDEWGNECGYDFKNIMYVRYKLIAPVYEGDSVYNKRGANIISSEIANGTLAYIWAGTENAEHQWSESLKSQTTGESKSFYTFSLISNDNVIDGSIQGICLCNVVKSVRQLPNIVAFNLNTDYGFLLNYFGDNCAELSLSGTTMNLHFSSCRGIVCGQFFMGSRFISVNKIILQKQCQNLSVEVCNNMFFEQNVNYILFENSSFCSFGEGAYMIRGFRANMDVGNNSSTIYAFNAYVVKLGNNCENIKINNANRLYFGNNVSNGSVDGVKFVEVVGDGVSNFHILEGTSGTANNNLTINFNSNYKGTQYAGLNSSGELKVWYPADCACEPTPSVA